MAVNTVQRQYYSLAEFAEIFGLDVRTIRRLIADGKVSAVRIGGSIRISIAEAERLGSQSPIGNAR